MFKTGKKPARPDAVKLKFSSYFTAAELPIVPVAFGRPWLVRQWGLLGNDLYGDCVWAGAAHETMLLKADAGFAAPSFMIRDVLADYSAVAGFDPKNPNTTDNGTDVQAAAAYRQKTGIGDANGNRHQIEIYTSLRVGDLAELALATFLNGVAGVGVDLPASAEDQFNAAEPWTVVKGDTSVGGHYIPCVGRNSAGNFLFVSWGKLQAATPAWVQEHMDEGIVFLSQERLSAKGLSPQGYDATALAADFKEVTA